MEGYIALPRDFRDDLVNLPADAVKLLVCLLYRANWADTLTCKRGELFDSTRALAEKCKMSRQSTRTSLRLLTDLGIISQKSTHRRTDIHIVNYDRFCGHGSKLTHSQPSLNPVLTHSQPSKKQLSSEEGKQINNINVQSEFERVWAKYPKPRGKKAALRHFTTTVKTPADVVAISSALNNYLQDLKSNGTSIQYTQNGSTWFNDWQSWQHAPSQHITPPRSLATPAIPSWKIIPSDDELVSQDEIKTLVSALQAGKGFPK